MRCAWCTEPIDPDADNPLPCMHRDCMVRALAGSSAHQLRQCACYGGTGGDPVDLTRRQAATQAAAFARKRTV